MKFIFLNWRYNTQRWEDIYMKNGSGILIAEKDISKTEKLKNILGNKYIFKSVENEKEIFSEVLHSNLFSLIIISASSYDNWKKILENLKRNPLTVEIPVFIIVPQENIDNFDFDSEAEDFIVYPYKDKIVKNRIYNSVTKFNLESGKLNENYRYDKLTGIYNRETFCRKTAEMLKLNSDEKYVLIRWDISQFNVINELFSIETGDLILKNIASQLRLHIDTKGTYGRLEADQFVMCFPQRFFDIENIFLKASQNFEILKPDYNVNVYMGIYFIDDINISVETMCDYANIALNTVKGNYLKHYAFYDESLHEKIMLEQRMSSEMQEALNSGQFHVYMQPVYSIMSETVISAEALVRWIHPLKGMISPAEFIPFFEKNGFIIKLDAYVWEEVCKYISKRKSANQKIVPISVNVSRINFYNPNLCNVFCSLIEKYNIEPSYLKLEVTESAYTENPQPMIEMIKKLQNHGFTILMDDFGSGYSSLNMLKNVPVDILKIDMLFVNDIDISGRAGNLITSVIRMAKWLDISVLAEGVETKGQLDYLKGIGCDSVQGYYFAKPMPISEFDELIENNKIIFHKYQNEILEKFDFDTIMRYNPEVNILFNGMIGGMGLYEFYDDMLEVIRVNDGYYDLMGNNPKIIFSDSKNILIHLTDESKSILIDACKKAVNTGEIQETVISRYHQNGKVLWLNLKIKYIGQSGRRSILYFVIDDITKRHIEESHNASLKYNYALLSLYDEIIDINTIENTSMNVFSKFCSRSSSEKISDYKSALETWINMNIKETDITRVKAFFNDMLKLKPDIPVSIEYEIKSKNDENKWCSSTLIYLSTGRYLCCNSDVSLKKQAEKIIEENVFLQADKKANQRYKIIIEQTNTVVFEWDLINHTFFTGKGYEQYAMSQVPAEDILNNKGPLDLVHPDDLQELKNFFEKTNSHLYEQITTELRIKKVNGEFVWSKMTATFVFDEYRKPSRVIGTINDISERKNAELELKKQADKVKKQLDILENLYSSVPCGIAHFHPYTGNLIYCNIVGRKMLGYEDDKAYNEMINSNLLNFIYSKDVVRLSELFEKCVVNHEIVKSGGRLIKKDGSLIEIVGRTTLTETVAGKFVMQIIFVNVSEKEVYFD